MAFDVAPNFTDFAAEESAPDLGAAILDLAGAILEWDVFAIEVTARAGVAVIVAQTKSVASLDMTRCPPVAGSGR